MKTCFKCQTQKPASEFYRHPMMSDGLLGKCKECTRCDSTANRNANIERVRAYDRGRANLPHRASQRYEVTQQWRKSDPRYNAAHNAVARAVKSGALTKQSCEWCGNEKTLAHHENYDLPLDVMWLCQPCHKKRHKQIDESAEINLATSHEQRQEQAA